MFVEFLRGLNQRDALAVADALAGGGVPAVAASLPERFVTAERPIPASSPPVVGIEPLVPVEPSRAEPATSASAATGRPARAGTAEIGPGEASPGEASPGPGGGTNIDILPAPRAQSSHHHARGWRAVLHWCPRR